MVKVDGKEQRAHRAMYKREAGPIPEELQLDHLCRNKGCVRPDHLEPVTGKVNVNRGPVTKLSDDDVRTIRAMDRDGMRGMDIAAHFAVSKGTISNILVGRFRSDVH